MAEFDFFKDVPVATAHNDTAGHPDLPHALQEIEALIGFDATMKLVDRWGGVKLYVPSQIGGRHRIARAIGTEAAQRLSNTYGGDRIDMPRAHVYRVVRRQIEVYRRHKAGEPVEKLAAEYGVTWRGIAKMVERETRRRAKIRYDDHMRKHGRKK